MFNDIDIMLDGELASDYGLMVVKVDVTGMNQVPFGIKQTIIEERNKSKYYLNRVDEEPLSFDVQLALDPMYNKWDFETRSKIIQWLFKKYYRCLTSPDIPDICFYVMVIGDPQRFDNALQDGYINLTFRCDASHAWTFPAIEEYDLSDNTDKTVIEIENRSNIREFYYPELEFTLQGSNSISFRNLTDGGRTLTFSNLQYGETIYIDGEKGTVISSLGENVYRLGDSNKNWLRLNWGLNRIEVIGKAYVTFRTQFPIAV